MTPSEWESKILPQGEWPKAPLDARLILEAEARQNVPTAIAFDDKEGWAVVQTSGQGPYVIWSERTPNPRAREVSVTSERILVTLRNGCSVSVPTDRFERLYGATQEQLSHFRLIGDGLGIHWPDLDEDLSVRGLITRCLGG